MGPDIIRHGVLGDRAEWPSGGRTRGWNNGQGRASDSLHLVCFGWPSDARRLTERDLMADGGLDLSALITIDALLKTQREEEVDRTAYDALVRCLRTRSDAGGRSSS
mgnify:FL=1